MSVRPHPVRGVGAAIVVAIMGGACLSAPPASATVNKIWVYGTTTHAQDHKYRRKPARLVALHVAAKHRGDPYRWGAEGPHAFDCSGLVLYAYRKAGRSLPRTAAQQYRHTRHEHRPRRGDLVFFHSGGHVNHVGIYAGHDRIWHAPHTGATVSLTRIWTRAVSYGRVR